MGVLAPLGMVMIFVIVFTVLARRANDERGRLLRTGGPESAEHRFDPAHAYSERGGARRGGASGNVTWPFARLTFDEDWAHLSGFYDLWIPRNRVVVVHRTKKLGQSGIRFEGMGGRWDDVQFWTFQPTRLWEELQRLGWTEPARTTSDPA